AGVGPGVAEYGALDLEHRVQAAAQALRAAHAEARRVAAHAVDGRVDHLPAERRTGGGAARAGAHGSAAALAGTGRGANASRATGYPALTGLAVDQLKVHVQPTVQRHVRGLRLRSDR